MSFPFTFTTPALHCPHHLHCQWQTFMTLRTPENYWQICCVWVRCSLSPSFNVVRAEHARYSSYSQRESSSSPVMYFQAGPGNSAMFCSAKLFVAFVAPLITDCLADKCYCWHNRCYHVSLVNFQLFLTPTNDLPGFYSFSSQCYCEEGGKEIANAGVGAKLLAVAFHNLIMIWWRWFHDLIWFVDDNSHCQIQFETNAI